MIILKFKFDSYYISIAIRDEYHGYSTNYCCEESTSSAYLFSSFNSTENKANRI